MSDRAFVLVVDDDPAIVRALQSLLEVAGYTTASATTGAAALEAAALHPPDVILLDMILPDMDGVAVCARLREWTQRPIVMLSALDGDALKIAALDMGADDYLRKPFSSGELLARLRAVMRRSARIDDGAPVVVFGDVVVDLSARSVRRAGELVHLTPREYALLAELARHAGRLLTHSALLEAVWGPRATRETQYLRVYVAGLRRKLEDDPSAPRHLRTEPGVGYRLDAEPLASVALPGA